jgi:hypothetical protein
MRLIKEFFRDLLERPLQMMMAMVMRHRFITMTSRI